MHAVGFSGAKTGRDGRKPWRPRQSLSSSEAIHWLLRLFSICRIIAALCGADSSSLETTVSNRIGFATVQSKNRLYAFNALHERRSPSRVPQTSFWFSSSPLCCLRSSPNCCSVPFGVRLKRKDAEEDIKLKSSFCRRWTTVLLSPRLSIPQTWRSLSGSNSRWCCLFVVLGRSAGLASFAGPSGRRPLVTGSSLGNAVFCVLRGFQVTPLMAFKRAVAVRGRSLVGAPNASQKGSLLQRSMLPDESPSLSSTLLQKRSFEALFSSSAEPRRACASCSTRLYNLKRHVFRRKRWRRLTYGIGKANEDVSEPLPLPAVDEMYVGKFRVVWTIRNYTEKLRWRYREMKAPPLRTSRFNLAQYRGLQLRFWPDGHAGSLPGHVALSLFQPECWEKVEDHICLFVGNQKRGPFKFRSREYNIASCSLCAQTDLNIVNDELKVGVELSSI